MRRDAVDVLKDEGRAGDVGEERAEDEALYEAMPKKVVVAKERGKGMETRRHALLARPFGQRLARLERPDGEEDADGGEHGEDDAPRGEDEERSASDGSEDRRESVHEHEDGQEAREFDALGHVTRDGTRDDDAARARKSLQEAQCEKRFDGACVEAAHRDESEGDHARKERPFAPVHIAQRPEEDLPDGHAEQRHRQGQLRRRGRGGKFC